MRILLTVSFSIFGVLVGFHRKICDVDVILKIIRHIENFLISGVEIQCINWHMTA